MSPEYRMRGGRALCAGLAAVLALSLAACSDKTESEAKKATAKIENAAEAAVQKAKQAAAAAEQRKVDEDKRLAEEAAKAADAMAAADRELAAKVKAALLATPDLKHLAFDVRSSNGDVTLFGTAESNLQRRKAERVAAGVPGVRSVKDELKIVSGS